MENNPVFIDTSAFYSLMDRSDSNYEQAEKLWHYLLEKDLYLTTTNYVVGETLTLLQSRLGFEAANLFYQDVLSIADILWIDSPLHNLAYALWLSLGRKNISFVDCISFITMRQHGIETAFAFDSHFQEQGFGKVQRDERS